MIGGKGFDYYAQECRDQAVDTIEEIHFLLCTVMPIQEADLCWHYLVAHYYNKRPTAEA
jgi:hypothetical protein|tara:strand:+ start:1718 stop:1894 length:177 start_codon:yes stop_codon:yes gene_type:complete